jgi:hypothetical protein
MRYTAHWSAVCSLDGTVSLMLQSTLRAGRCAPAEERQASRVATLSGAITRCGVAGERIISATSRRAIS